MTVFVEKLEGLERKVTVSVPLESVEEEVTLRLRRLMPRVKVDGFRAGKVPFHVVKQRYADSCRDDVRREMVESTLRDALQSNELVPAGTPTIELGTSSDNDDFSYSAFFEVFPEISIHELGDIELEVAEAAIADADVDQLIEKLREQNKEWRDVERPVEKGDKLTIDFEAFFVGEDTPHTQQNDHELIIGQEQMIAGFEDGVIGATMATPVELNLSFPADYHSSELAGKDVRFLVTIKSIKEGVLPALDDAFLALFDVETGGIDALKQDIRKNMQRELERRLNTLNRERVFDAALEINVFDVPHALVDREIEHLKHEMYHRVFGHEHTENEKIPDFPRVLFEESAKRRVHLGLLFAEYVKQHKMVVEPARVEAMISQLSSSYDDPEGLSAWYREKKERMAEVEALVLEEMVAEKMAADAKKVTKVLTYDDVMKQGKSV